MKPDDSIKQAPKKQVRKNLTVKSLGEITGTQLEGIEQDIRLAEFFKNNGMSNMAKLMNDLERAQIS